MFGESAAGEPPGFGRQEVRFMDLPSLPSLLTVWMPGLGDL